MIINNLLLHNIKEYLLNSIFKIRRGWKEENIILLCGSCENPLRKYQLIECFQPHKFECPHCKVNGFIEQRDIVLTQEINFSGKGVIPFIELGDSKEWDIFSKDENCKEISYKVYKTKMKELKRLNKLSKLERYKEEVFLNKESKIEIEKLREVLVADRISDNNWDKKVWKRVNGKG